MLLTITICTHNRSRILNGCLESIATQKAGLQEFEVLVIDNNSTDDTKARVKDFEGLGIRYVFEEKTGLSYARNRGAKEAKGQWIAYLDDDVLLSSNYVERALWGIKNNDFDCFGGSYFAEYNGEKPKWIANDFETMIIPRDTIGLIVEPILVGMNFLIKKQLVEELGGFNTGFGMAGDTIGYGEENDMQKRLLAAGYKIGIDPELVVRNVILPHKLQFTWHLKSWYAHGRDGQRFSKKHNLIRVFWLFFWSFSGGIVKLPIAISKLALKKNYFWQNMVWDVVSPMLYRIGQIVGTFK
ncbi:MAG: glycosyltransferase [Saprospiraceae bacterium]|nr:glycosyltransferase [Saprospiraceae bacterium]MCF8251423.1 glycosyltransferase [Saprospiraceae bacterium]MCF8312697.1 glycosyltransferase [Saprospiraceae bacterium]MCF8441037.1 glycosyltransferase [Saprospiraceae bacterium]